MSAEPQRDCGQCHRAKEEQEANMASAILGGWGLVWGLYPMFGEGLGSWEPGHKSTCVEGAVESRRQTDPGPALLASSRVSWGSLIGTRALEPLPELGRPLPTTQAGVWGQANQQGARQPFIENLSQIHRHTQAMVLGPRPDTAQHLAQDCPGGQPWGDYEA